MALINSKVEQWKFNIYYLVPGAIEIDLSGYLATDKGQQFLISSFNEIREKLQESGEAIPANHLNSLSLQLHSDYKIVARDIKTEIIDQQIVRIINLIEGKEGMDLSLFD